MTEQEKPFRYIKKLVHIGHSSYLIVPQAFASRLKGIGEKVIMEIYPQKKEIVIRPLNHSIIKEVNKNGK